MHELFYCSYAVRPMESSDILDILEVSRKNNEVLGVTGLLLYYNKTRQFMQILEGEKELVLDLYRNICNDSRHTSIQKVYDGAIAERAFGDWSMAFTNFSEIDKSKIPAYSNFLETGFTPELLENRPNMAVKIFKTFREVLP